MPDVQLRSVLFHQQLMESFWHTIFKNVLEFQKEYTVMYVKCHGLFYTNIYRSRGQV